MRFYDYVKFSNQVATKSFIKTNLIFFFVFNHIDMIKLMVPHNSSFVNKLTKNPLDLLVYNMSSEKLYPSYPCRSLGVTTTSFSYMGFKR